MKKILLWITMIPGAVFSVIAFTISTRYLFKLWHDDETDWHWFKTAHIYLPNALESFLFPLLFILIGTAIAPKFKHKVGMLLIAVMVVYIIVIAVLLLIANGYNLKLDDQSIISYVFHFLGCGVSYLFIPKAGDEVKNNRW